MNRTYRFRNKLALALTAAALGVTAPLAKADTYPSKPVTLLIGFAPGGAADTVARVLAEEMSKTLGQRVIVENRAGAGGNVATLALVNGQADGYTLLFAAINLATNPALMNTKYDPDKDLAMVSQITSVPVIMLAPGESSLKSPADVVRQAATSNGGFKIGSGGNGTSSHLAAELFMRSHKLEFIHAPYRGGAPANMALMAGEIQLMFDLMSGSLKSTVDSGRIRPLAVMQESRITAMPNLPSAKELGLSPSTFIRSWQGIAVKGGTPPEIVNKLHASVTAALKTPAFKDKVEALGSEVVGSKTPAAFQEHYKKELARWTALIKAANIKSE
ncbi:tripartite tricarboxylate transporter substrate binding protein [Piscinibacter sp. HJYY11]|uniref:Bug family tripartite tricarboxylate transporter substrate binding protein n=1 Tax=Piscinibacter sp. HJYY11 TaxID=2801333 RepID=UPI001920021B|nr:tripartite tricarboxylate transporter substrate binding protein [Piscinibacter sp. HJYY11]MBL0727216.1 tripartite tricarboxylate transporter substrate binding protein [Piscinibacter sp. HJYY11]